VLINLEYIELLGSDSKFIGVMLADDLISKEKKFVEALKNGTVLTEFRNFIVTESIAYDTGAIDALDLIRRSGKKFLPLLDGKGYMKGVVTETALEKSIADEVLKARR
jgi:CBS-domain-containing membrane protein